MLYVGSGRIFNINNLMFLKLSGIMIIFAMGIVVTIPAVAATPHIMDCYGEEQQCEDIDGAIERAVSFLEMRQQPSGEFVVDISGDPEMVYIMNDSIYNHTVFGSAFILHTLAYLKSTPKINNIKNISIEFLLANIEPPGAWSYGGKYYHSPQDADDTALAFSALEENGVKLNDYTLRYMLNFRTESGLFHTWMLENRTDHSDPHSPLFALDDVDPAVNAYVLYTYALNDIYLEEVSRFLNNYTKNKLFINGTLYYPSQYAFIYRLTLAYSADAEGLDSAIPGIRKYLLSTQRYDGSWGNDLENGFATVSLINIGYRGKALDKAINP